MRKLKIVLLIVAVTGALCGCDRKEPLAGVFTEVTLTLEFPPEYDVRKLQATLTVQNKNNSRDKYISSDFSDGRILLTVQKGYYNIIIQGAAYCHKDGSLQAMVVKPMDANIAYLFLEDSVQAVLPVSLS